MTKYVYPKLPSDGGITTPFFRISGNGLANCLFIYARAIAYAHKYSAKIIAPTWLNLSVGPYLRHERDKRHYLGLFNSRGELAHLNKLFHLIFCKKRTKVVDGLSNYFEDIVEDAEFVSKYIIDHVCENHLVNVDNFDFTDKIAIHVRLGDYDSQYRIPLSWYKEKIENLSKEYTNASFLLFSDGTDEELRALLDLNNVQRVFFGNAIADIVAISKCKYLIGSDSTFSGWGAFLGQVPCVFYRKHYGRVLKDVSKEIVENGVNVWR